MKSLSGPITVLLVNKDGHRSNPIVVEVPPPKQEAVGNEHLHSSLIQENQTSAVGTRNDKHPAKNSQSLMPVSSISTVKVKLTATKFLWLLN